MILPEAVLLPHGIMPLCIFEPRYRAMLAWALEHDRMFCVAQMKPGISNAVKDDQFFHTAGLGLISASVTQPDGRSHLVLHGMARVRFEGFVRKRPFRIARIREIATVEGDAAEAGALTEEVHQLCKGLRLHGVKLPTVFGEMLRKIANAGTLADTVGASLITDMAARQLLLEEPDVTERLRILTRVLREKPPGKARRK